MNATTQNESPPPEAGRLWLLRIVAREEPQLLARLLTKVAIPSVTLLAVDYRFAEQPGQATCTLCLRMAPSWADLVHAKLRQVVAVEEVSRTPLWG